MTEFFGGTSTEQLGNVIRAAAASDRVSGIVLDIDSPGGTTPGLEVLAKDIREARNAKPVVAVANSLAASAAYWIGSQANEFYAAPGADVGSIGVFRMHEDVSEMLAQEGVKVSFIATPEFKVEGNPFESLSDAAREHHQQQVDATYETFVRDVAVGRGVSQQAVIDTYGKGRVFHAEQAAEMGLVNGVRTLDDVLRAMSGNSLSGELACGLESEAVEIWQGTRQAFSDPDATKRRAAALDRKMKLLAATDE